MPQPFHFGYNPGPRSSLAVFIAWLPLLMLLTAGAAPAPRAFDIPAETAERSLKRFSEQSGIDVVIATQVGRDVRTHEVKGVMPAREALDTLLSGTGLVAVEDKKSGAFTVMRGNDPNAERASPREAPAEVLKLSPFVVDSSTDRGYYSSQTLAGGRLKTQLKDVATSVQVVTTEMLQDIGATSLDEVLQYTTNTDAVGVMSNYAGLQDGDGTGTLNQSEARQNPGDANRVRGMAAPTRTTNYFETLIPFDSYNSGRIDINRGANSFLFGLGSPSGIINNSLADAELNKDSITVDSQVSTQNFEDNTSKRASVNLNKVIIPKRLAIRVAGLENREEYMQHPAHTDSSRRYAALKFKPWTEHSITLSANYETGTIKSVPVDRLGPLETLSTFINDPYGTKWKGVGTVTNAAGRRVQDPFGNILLNSTGGNVGYLGRDINGVPLTIAQYDTFLKRNGWASVYDGTEDAAGLPTRAVHTGWTNGRIGRGSRTFDPDNNLLGNNQAVMGKNLSNTEIVSPAFDGFSRQGLVGYEVFDFSRHLMAGSIDNFKNNFDRHIISLEAVSKRGDFGLELAYADEVWKRDSFVAVNAPELDIDINYSFPIGPNALFGNTNPNFGRLYFYAPSSNQTLNTDKRETIRATAFAQFDFAKKFDRGLLKWFGRHRVSGLYDQNTLDQKRFVDKPLVYGNDAAFHLGDARATIFQRQWSGIFYVSGPNPQAFENPNFKVSDFKTAGLAPSASVKYPNGVQIPLAYLSEGNPARDAAWNVPIGDETTAIGSFTPAFTPFSGVLTRTKTESMALNLQSFFLRDHVVANLGWRSDEVSLARNGTPPLNADTTPIRDSAVFNLNGTPARVEKQSNFSYGLVLKVPSKWLPKSTGMTFHFGHSDNFVPNPGGFDLEGHSVPNAAGKTREYGVTVSALNDKLVARLNVYRGSVVNQNFTGTTGAVTTLSNGHIARNFNGLYLDMDQYDRNRDGIFDLVQDPLDRTGRTFIDPDKNRNGILDKVEPGGAEYVPGATYMPLDQFTKIFNQYDAFYNAWAKKTAESVLIPGTVSGSNADAVASSGSGLSEVLTDTVDLVAKGIEFELTYNPTPNLRFSFNVAQQQSQLSNVAPRLEKMIKSLIAIAESVPLGPYLVGSQQVINRLTTPLATTPFASNTMTGAWLRANNIGGVYFAQKALAGSDNPEVRKYRANLLGNYSFSEGRLKGIGVGGAFRWQDKAAIGYPVTYDPTTGVPIKNVTKPYYDDGSKYVDCWVGYKRKFLQGKVGWKVQLNIRNVFADGEPVVVQVQPNGAPARVSIPVPRQFVLSNTFTF